MALGLSAANATPFYFNLGDDYSRGYDHIKTDFTATSTIYDAYCVSGKCSPTLDSHTTDVGAGYATSFEPGSGFDFGLRTEWNLNFSYDISGNFDGGVPNYTEGAINLDYSPIGGASQQVLSLDVTQGKVTDGNVWIEGVFDFSWYDPMLDDGFAADFLSIMWQGEMTSIYDLWLADEYVTWKFQFNVNDNDNVLWDEIGDGIGERFLDIGGRFTVVSEPGVLAMFGLGLCLLGVRRRQRR